MFEGLPARADLEQFRLACARVTLSAAAGRDGSGIPADQGAKLADRAMADLREAVAKGYRNAPLFRQEPDLAPLRARDDFRALIAELEKPPAR